MYMMYADLFTVDLMHVFEHIQEIAGVTEFVVIVGDQLEKMVIQFNGLSGVKDGGMGISHKVTGNHFIIDIFQNAFQISLGSSSVYSIPR